VVNDITAPLYEAAGAKGLLAETDSFVRDATETPVDPHQYVGEYESMALAYRVIPHEKGIAVRLRGKVRFYDSDSLDESAPVPLRLIRDNHFTTGQGFITFLNPGRDGRMQHLGARRRLHKRSR
jgi:hypothetical protein